MILSDRGIKERLGKDIIITPYNEKQLNPNSYNLTLNKNLICYNKRLLRVDEYNPYHSFEIPPEGLKLKPGWVYLARTNEWTETHNLVPMLEGRSSIGRLGLSIHVTAGFGDVGFAGYWTLELSCVQPLIIYPNIEIAQIYYLCLDKPPLAEYNGKYQNQNGVIPSKMYFDFLSKT
mgnify:CR=1 FL=1